MIIHALRLGLARLAAKMFRDDSPYNLVSWDDGARFVVSTTALARFEEKDSVAEMTLGEAITGICVGLKDLWRWVIVGKKSNLFCHYLSRLSSEILPGRVTEYVHRILQLWAFEDIERALNEIERLFPNLIRQIRDDERKNLLILCEENTNHGARLSNLLRTLGCDPDKKCLKGYSWNDMHGSKGKK